MMTLIERSIDRCDSMMKIQDPSSPDTNKTDRPFNTPLVPRAALGCKHMCKFDPTQLHHHHTPQTDFTFSTTNCCPHRKRLTNQHSENRMLGFRANTTLPCCGCEHQHSKDSRVHKCSASQHLTIPARLICPCCLLPSPELLCSANLHLQLWCYWLCPPQDFEGHAKTNHN